VELVRAEELSRLDQARSQLTREEVELKRIETLARDAIATPSELDTQRTRVETAQASLKTMEAQLGDRLVRAPFAGVVGLRRVSPGSLVTPTTLITTLDAIDPLYADLPLPERFIGQIRPGQTVRLRSDAYPDAVFEGQVTAVAGRVDPATRAIVVRARVANPQAQLRPGMLVRGILGVGTRTSPAVPEHALVQRASRAFVYTVNAEDTVALVEVEIGRRDPGWVEIRTGLQGGERVVADGTNRVQPGAKVHAVEN
jgi:membrane fusion protein (multidrug efflux system)